MDFFNREKIGGGGPLAKKDGGRGPDPLSPPGSAHGLKIDGERLCFEYECAFWSLDIIRGKIINSSYLVQNWYILLCCYILLILVICYILFILFYLI